MKISENLWKSLITCVFYLVRFSCWRSRSPIWEQLLWKTSLWLAMYMLGIRDLTSLPPLRPSLSVCFIPSLSAVPIWEAYLSACRRRLFFVCVRYTGTIAVPPSTYHKRNPLAAPSLTEFHIYPTYMQFLRTFSMLASQTWVCRKLTHSSNVFQRG